MIRFKKDDGTDFPELTQSKFENVCLKIGDGLHSAPEYSDNGEYYFINGNNLQKGKIVILPDNPRVDETTFLKNDKNLDETTILMSINGTIGNVAYYSNEKVMLGKSAAYLMIKKPNNKKYIFQLLQTIGIQNQFKKGLTGSTIKNLGLTTIKQTKFLLPCVEEQQKIADFLSSVDDVITASEQEVAALEEQKKGAMQKIFSQEVRFKADDGSDYPEWEELKLEDCCNGFDNQRKPVSAAKRESGNVPYYGANGIQDYVKDYIFDGEYVLLAEDGGNFDDFATRPIAQYISGKAWVNNHAHVIQAKENSITKYIFYTLVHKDIRKYINGTSRSKLNQADMWMIQIPVPRLEEQQKIADFLSDFDTAIYLAKQELEQWKELKKGLLQQLFE